VFKEPNILKVIPLGKYHLYFSTATISLVLANLFFVSIFVMYDRNYYVTFVIDYIFRLIRSINNEHLEVDCSVPLTFVFIYVCFLNIIGCFGLFPVTSTPSVPLTFSIVLFVYGIIKGASYKGFRVLTDLVPKQFNTLFKIVFFPLEAISIILKPFSIGVRLLANVVISHFVQHIICIVIVKLNLKVAGVLLLTALNMLEILKSIFQGYLFCIFSVLMIKSFCGGH
jgi:F0F1-type ATP synthase membrane subunit a